MDKMLLACWGLSEIFTAVVLINGMADWSRIFVFLNLHGITILSTVGILYQYAGENSRLRNSLMSRGFLFFLGILCILPFTGPAVALSILMYLRFFSSVLVRTESFNIISQDVLISLQKQLEGRTIPITEALLIRQLSRDDALRMLSVLDEMDWTAAKSGILKYIIRLGPYQNIVLVAIDMLKKKTDAIFAEIVRAETHKSNGNKQLRVLASLYHEICYLDLCEPAMKQIYLNKACDYALQAFREGGGVEEDALLAVRYLLEAGRIDEAYGVYVQSRKNGAYYLPKWVPYEFELSVRRTDAESFNNLSLLIESAGGVYVPNKVKQAASAWKKVLTSAWL